GLAGIRVGDDCKGAPPLHLGREGRLNRGARRGTNGHVHGGLHVAVRAIRIKTEKVSAASCCGTLRLKADIFSRYPNRPALSNRSSPRPFPHSSAPPTCFGSTILFSTPGVVDFSILRASRFRSEPRSAWWDATGSENRRCSS